MATRTGRILHWPIRLLPRSLPLPILGGRLRRMRWFVRAGMVTQWLGTYERKKLDLLTRFLKEGLTVFDIGAHVGYYTLFFSKSIGPKGKVVAFEPVPENASWLVKHVKVNHAEQNTIVYSSAISSRNGVRRFDIREHSAIGKLSTHHSSSILLVPVFSLDSLCSEGIADELLPVPDIVKMDIEGEEVSALEGSTDILKKRKTTWFIALHSEDALIRCLEMFDHHGYDVFTLDGVRLTEPIDGLDEIYAMPRES